jgi:competence protein ComFB
MAFRNYMEEAVVEEFTSFLKNRKDACPCEKCRQDMVAYVLNRMPAKYVVTDLGSAYTKLDQLKTQSRADILVRLMEASEVVRKKPRH